MREPKKQKKPLNKIDRIAVAFEAGRDGFWLARWLRARGIEAHVIHTASVPPHTSRRDGLIAGLGVARLDLVGIPLDALRAQRIRESFPRLGLQYRAMHPRRPVSV